MTGAGLVAPFRQGPVRVRVPATSANLGPGFDSFGLALALHNEVTVRVTDHGLHVEVTGDGSSEVPRDERNLVVHSMRAAFERLGGQPPGLEVRCTNRIPHGRGLGSSAAAIVAGVVAARELVIGGTGELPDDAVLELAARLEGHPDNVAACLLGGLTVAWRDTSGGVRALRLEADSRIRAVLFLSEQTAATADTRRTLPEQVPHQAAARNVAYGALLIAALTRRPDLLLDATRDELHQPYRAAVMPASAELIDRLRSEGIAAVLSGAGPTVLALADAAEAPRVAALEVPGFRPMLLAVDTRGTGVELLVE